MGYRFFRRYGLWSVAAVAVGILIGGLLPRTPIHATATDRTDTFMMATGMLDQNLEAVFLFDCLTGDLMATALQKPPYPGGFGGVWRYNNVLGDLGVDPSKNPKFLMVTGVADLEGGTASNNLGYSALYIVELTSGTMVAYAVPYKRSLWNTRRPIQENLILIGKMRFRNTPPLRMNFQVPPASRGK
ncbi:MAG: hypothetical protein JXB10_18295 [Pirellulales bacterium]|nr:hypothetical protein [Pirellulales bacterium]